MKRELCFHSWGFPNYWYGASEVYVWKIHPQPKPIVPGLLSDATSVTLVLKCED